MVVQPLHLIRALGPDMYDMYRPESQREETIRHDMWEANKTHMRELEHASLLDVLYGTGTGTGIGCTVHPIPISVFMCERVRDCGDEMMVMTAIMIGPSSHHPCSQESLQASYLISIACTANRPIAERAVR